MLARARYSDDWSLWFFHFPYAVLPSPTPKTIHLGAQYWPEGQGKAQFTFPAKGEFQEMLLQP